MNAGPDAYATGLAALFAASAIEQQGQYIQYYISVKSLQRIYELQERLRNGTLEAGQPTTQCSLANATDRTAFSALQLQTRQLQDEVSTLKQQLRLEHEENLFLKYQLDAALRNLESEQPSAPVYPEYQPETEPQVFPIIPCYIIFPPDAEQLREKRYQAQASFADNHCLINNLITQYQTKLSVNEIDRVLGNVEAVCLRNRVIGARIAGSADFTEDLCLNESPADMPAEQYFVSSYNSLAVVLGRHVVFLEFDSERDARYYMKCCGAE